MPTLPDFDFTMRPSDAPFVDLIWHTRSGPAGAFISAAVSQWEMVITRQAGTTTVSVRGPETRATPAPIPANAEFLGIAFKLGTFMPHLPVNKLVNSAVDLPEAAGKSFWLHGAAWPLPSFENADTFIARLIGGGLLDHDPVIAAALNGQPAQLSARSVQRRFLHATGMSQNTIYQINRAQQAADLLEQGCSILDVVALAGYADQPHMTRALKQYVGQTPAQIARASLPG